MAHIEYTIFQDRRCRIVIGRAVLDGEKADEAIARFKHLAGWDALRVDDTVCGCRVDVLTD